MKRALLMLAPAFAAFAAGSPPAARADTVLYSNVTNFSGFGYATGGAMTQPSSSTISTPLVADDINTKAGSGGATVDAFQFSVFNNGSTAVTANVDVRLYASDGANGGPGTLIAGFNFNPISFAAGTVGVYTFAPGTPLFTIPTNGTLWAGEFFTNASNPGTTAAQLSNLGAGIFAPPTVGSSSDVFFQSTTGGTDFTGNNPTGGFFYFGGNPAADFGWSFSGTPLATVPEPSTFALAGLGLVSVVLAKRRKRARA